MTAAGFLIQLVPYGRDHANPPSAAEPPWDRPRTRELVVRWCFDCHSNAVSWPWYSNVAPISWVISDHVRAGREELNYSESDRRQDAADESAEAVHEGEMPPRYYTLARPWARLSGEERAALNRGLAATFGEEDERDEDDD